MCCFRKLERSQNNGGTLKGYGSLEGIRVVKFGIVEILKIIVMMDFGIGGICKGFFQGSFSGCGDTCVYFLIMFICGCRYGKFFCIWLRFMIKIIKKNKQKIGVYLYTIKYYQLIVIVQSVLEQRRKKTWFFILRRVNLMVLG